MLPRITPIVQNLIIINALFFFADNIELAFMEQMVGRSYASEYFRPWQVVTHMFMHADFQHLLFNMFGLFFFGTALESYFGSKRFLTYYLLCGVGAFILYQLTHFVQIQFLLENLSAEEISMASKGSFNPNNPASHTYTGIVYTGLVGASGAVFGLLFGYALKFPQSRVQLLFPPVVLTAKQLAIGYGALELFLTFSNIPGDNVAHTVHLLGGLVGFIIIKYWEKNSNQYREY